MTWTHHKEFDYWEVQGRRCSITLEKRPHYCDRGNFIAKIHPNPKATIADQGWILLGIDAQDGWPRYYFDEGRAKAEIEAWLVKRKEAIVTPP